VAPAPADPPVFSLDVTTDAGGRTTVAVAGELDIATAGELSDAVRAGIDTGAVVLDLRNVTFMDSSCVRALNGALRDAERGGRELWVLEGLHPSVLQVLELTGMLGLLPVGQPR
jgi:anti-sigma B factor antagonist